MSRAATWSRRTLAIDRLKAVSLGVIPALRPTNRGVVDGVGFTLVSPIAK